MTPSRTDRSPQVAAADALGHTSADERSVLDQIATVVARFSRLRKLSARETEIIRLAGVEGRAIKEIAAVLDASRKTIEQYWSRIYLKTGCHSQLEVVAALFRSAVRPPER
jgi:DNA-binding NarL/FixJ family response regulator